MIEKQNQPIQKIRLIEDNIQNIVQRPSNNKIKFLSKEEAQVLIEQQHNQQQNIQSSQQQFSQQTPKIDFNPRFPIIPIYDPPFLDIPSIFIKDPKDMPRKRSRTPRKEISRLTQSEIDHYTFEILKVFQSADQRRRQLQNRNI